MGGTSGCVMTDADESPQGKFAPRDAHSWGVIRPATEVKVGCVNVTTLGQDDGREFLVGRTLGKFGVDVCGISETKWKGSGIRDIGDYSVYYSGVGEEEDAYGGVGIAIRKDLVKSVSAWDYVNERLMWVRFGKRNVPTTFIVCYAPTNDKGEEVKDAFYDELERLVERVPERDYLVVFGDFNARVGRDNCAWSGVLGRHGLSEEVTDNGERLLRLCAASSLCVVSTFFRHKRIHKFTHYSRNKQKTRSQIDHILVRSRWISSIGDARVFRSADFCNTDHRLLLARMRLKLKAKRVQAKGQLDLDRLRDPAVQLQFELAVSNRFMRLEDELNGADIETHWAEVKETTLAVAGEVCGVRRKRKKKWLDDTVEQLSEAKDSLFLKWQATEGHSKGDEVYREYKAANRTCMRAVRAAKAAHREKMVEELEQHAKNGDTRAVYQVIKELGKTGDSRAGTLRGSNGEVILDIKGRMKRWEEHFQRELNVGKSIDVTLIRSIGAKQVDRPASFKPPDLL